MPVAGRGQRERVANENAPLAPKCIGNSERPETQRRRLGRQRQQSATPSPSPPPASRGGGGSRSEMLWLALKRSKWTANCYQKTTFPPNIGARRLSYDLNKTVSRSPLPRCFGLKQFDRNWKCEVTDQPPPPQRGPASAAKTSRIPAHIRVA